MSSSDEKWKIKKFLERNLRQLKTFLIQDLTKRHKRAEKRSKNRFRLRNLNSNLKKKFAQMEKVKQIKIKLARKKLKGF